MKLFKNFAIACFIIALTSHVSVANSIDDPNGDLRNAVTELLINPEINEQINETVRISFFVTADDELVVLRTDARTKKLDEYIKSRMNYHKINVDDLDINRIFHLKVRFQLEQ